MVLILRSFNIHKGNNVRTYYNETGQPVNMEILNINYTCKLMTLEQEMLK